MVWVAEVEMFICHLAQWDLVAEYISLVSEVADLDLNNITIMCIMMVVANKYSLEDMKEPVILL